MMTSALSHHEENVAVERKKEDNEDSLVAEGPKRILVPEILILRSNNNNNNNDDDDYDSQHQGHHHHHHHHAERLVRTKELVLQRNSSSSSSACCNNNNNNNDSMPGELKTRAAAATPSRRRVWFQQDTEGRLCVDTIWIRPLSSLSQDEVDSLWWQKEDYVVMKRTAKAIASAIRQGNSSSSSDRSCQSSSSIMSRSGRLSYCQAIQRLYSNCVRRRGGSQPCLEKVDLESFQLWVAAGHSRRGLESWCVPGLQRDRYDRMKGAIRETLKVYKESVAKDPVGSPSDDNCFFGSSHDDDDERLRAKYKELSTPFAEFALAFARADEKAVEFDTKSNGRSPTLASMAQRRFRTTHGRRVRRGNQGGVASNTQSP